MYIHSCMHACMHIYIYIYIYSPPIPSSMHMQTYIYMYAYIHTHVRQLPAMTRRFSSRYSLSSAFLSNRPFGGKSASLISFVATVEEIIEEAAVIV